MVGKRQMQRRAKRAKERTQKTVLRDVRERLQRTKLSETPGFTYAVSNEPSWRMARDRFEGVEGILEGDFGAFTRKHRLGFQQVVDTAASDRIAEANLYTVDENSGAHEQTERRKNATACAGCGTCGAVDWPSDFGNGLGTHDFGGPGSQPAVAARMAACKAAHKAIRPGPAHRGSRPPIMAHPDAPAQWPAPSPDFRIRCKTDPRYVELPWRVLLGGADYAHVRAGTKRYKLDRGPPKRRGCTALCHHSPLTAPVLRTWYTTWRTVGKRSDARTYRSMAAMQVMRPEHVPLVSLDWRIFNLR